MASYQQERRSDHQVRVTAFNQPPKYHPPTFARNRSCANAGVCSHVNRNAKRRKKTKGGTHVRNIHCQKKKVHATQCNADILRCSEQKKKKKRNLI
jgi:hypothetical protein